MFEQMPRVWTPVAFPWELRAKPLPLRVAGERVVLFCDGGGVARALVDRCPHRGAALSLGRVEDGCLRCPFHGWRFDGEGRCVEVPWHPDARRERLAAVALATHESRGFVWIFTATGMSPSGLPTPPAETELATTALTGHTFLWRAHWTRAVENMVDESHLPFVHPRTIGRGVRKPPASRLTLDVTDEPWGWSWRAVVDGARQDWESELRWPNVSLLRIDAGRKPMGICFAAVPVDEHYVRILQLGYRGLLRSSLFDPVFRYINGRVLDEDRTVVESSPPGPVPHPAAEPSVPTDAIGLRFRKRYFAEMAVAEAAAPPRLPRSRSP